MKLVKYGTFVALAFGVASMAMASPGCSSSSTNDGGTSGGGVKPPAKPADAPTPSMDEMTFAIDSLLLGDTPKSSTSMVSTTAWKDYGFDLDGKITDAKSTDVCTRATGAPTSVQVDGNQGRDNSFGANILPIVQSAGSIPNPSSTISDYIKQGRFTILMKIKGLSGMAMQTNTGLSAQLFASGEFPNMMKPTFTTADDWPVRPELLKDGKTVAGGSKVEFTGSYITNGTWVSGSPGVVTISLVFSGVALDLSISQAVIVMDINGNDATNGTIAGVLDTDQLISGLKTVAGRISKSLCGTAFDGIAQQIRQTSDILKDGTNAPGTPCDAISVGIGFTAKKVKNPSQVAALSNPSPDPCTSDGGTETDSGTIQDAGGGG